MCYSLWDITITTYADTVFSNYVDTIYFEPKEFHDFKTHL